MGDMRRSGIGSGEGMGGVFSDPSSEGEGNEKTTEDVGEGVHSPPSMLRSSSPSRELFGL